MRKLIFFDLDGTILGGFSSENAFFVYLLKHGYLGIKQFLAAFWFILRWIWTYRQYVFIKNKAYLAGLPVETITRLGQLFTRETLLSRIRPALKDRILAHQKEGDIVVLLTGSYDFMAQVFAEYLHIPHVEATECVIHEHHFQAAPPIQHPFRHEKLAIAVRLCQAWGYTLNDCVAYGNSINDAILLRAVGHAIAVTPDRHLRKLAKQYSWEILKLGSSLDI